MKGIGELRLSDITLLAFKLNSLMDAEDRVPIAEVQEHLEDKTVFRWLEERLDRDHFSITYAEQSDAEETLLDLFSQLWNAVDARRKFGIEHDGIALLLAYCIEAIQQWAQAHGHW